uniref:Uncharacterized protein n=1 Tax=viral metagenome TaxID=1070528 RepID=A0A6C0IIF0_9ZZZZ
MLFFTLKTIFISLMLIALIHYLYAFLKDTLTIPKVKDLVNKPAKRYDEMYDMMQNKHAGMQQGTGQQGTGQQGTGQQGTGQQGTGQQGTGQQGTGQQIKQDTSMQDELKNFLSELKKPDLAQNVGPNVGPNVVKYKNTMNDSFPTANELSSGSYSPF